MYDPDLQTFRLFLTVHDLGNITRAAERSNIAVSAVTKRLQDLEAHYHVRLFDRQPRGVKRDRQKIGGQAAMAISVTGSTSASKSCPKAEPSLPLRAAQRTWSRRSAPRRDHRICCDLFMRRLTRKLAVPSVSDVPTGTAETCGDRRLSAPSG